MATVNRKYFGPRALGAVVRMLLGFDRRIAEAETAVGKAVEDAEARMNESVAVASEATTAATEIAGKAAEGERVRTEAERGRVGAESTRESKETARQSAETTRQKDEIKRVEAEALREQAENEREAKERARVSAESTRESKETARQSAETTRQENETKRVEAEALRKQAESKREEAEAARATEFESWESEIDGKADRSELSNIVGTPTGNVIEEIEPTLVADALRKVPQTLTPEEQAQVKANLGVYDRQWLIDLFVTDPNGGYDYNATDGHPYLLNGLRLTETEALNTAIYGNKLTGNADYNGSSAYPHIRTNLTPVNVSNNSYCRTLDNLFQNQTELEVAVISGYNNKGGENWGLPGVLTTGTLYQAFNQCTSLRRIIGFVYLTYAANSTKDGAFKGCVSLEDVWFVNLREDLNLQDCARLSLWTVNKLVEYANNSKAVTVTVHPDVYAKLTDESNTEWYAVLTAAAAKNITFATI